MEWNPLRLRKADTRKDAVLVTWFNFSNPFLFFPRAHVYADRLELRGWHLQGHYRRSLKFRRILHVDVTRKRELLIWLTTGEQVRLRINRPNHWKGVIDARLSDLSASPPE